MRKRRSNKKLNLSKETVALIAGGAFHRNTLRCHEVTPPTECFFSECFYTACEAQSCTCVPGPCGD